MFDKIKYTPDEHVFDPRLMTVLGLTENEMLGKAMNIMLNALGFGMVQISQMHDVCTFGGRLKPTFVLFAPEYLSTNKAFQADPQCPCDKRQNCNHTLTVVFLKTRTFENVMKSKEMGFDGIIFADEPIEKIYGGLQRIYEKKYTV